MGNHLLCIVGPTACGKSAVAARLAERIGGEVVNCDSVQIYRELNAGSAKPLPEETRSVPHHMLDCACAFDPWNAARYAREASRRAEEIRSRGNIPVVCGGSGLYMRALTDGLADIPDCPRRDHGPLAYEKLLAADPVTAARLPRGDTQRVARALDVYAATGRPLSSFFAAAPPPAHTAAYIGITRDRQELRERVALRAAAMLRGGLCEETDALVKSGLSAARGPLLSIGYKQALQYLSGLLSAEELPEAVNSATMAYAKRQYTWFRRLPGIRWFDAASDGFFNDLARYAEGLAAGG
ncbi:MAG: tRNA (adenosine(37)-N6)-dimethylallyltransferase MiaA [Oscillospiraceae bacterium]|jgi:tRNA dimethylallyltransferase|nr:tRNA (adenosine(37)-N6)-dimethylallyltransferase MiaA [Oscillospiraceae bacterium]